MAGARILIVDDSTANRKILSDMVSRWGAVVTETDDGESGLTAIRLAAQAGEPYDLVLLDSQMPGLDGYQVADYVGKHPALCGPVIMMLTSDDLKSGIEKSKALGISHYLLKPVKWSDLKEEVIAALEQKAPAAEVNGPLGPQAAVEKLSAMRILLVEDNEKSRLVIEAFLKQAPYKMDTAEHGEIAVEKFKAGHYDLVLMDIEMPVMDGYTATAEIRRWEAENRMDATPIIALTAHALVEHAQKSIAAGCSSYLAKPVKKQELLAVIRKYSHGAKSTPVDPSKSLSPALA